MAGIQLQGINCFYGNSQALFDVNLSSEAGDIIVLLGPSGAGKSSLLRVFNLMQVPVSGNLMIDNYHFNFADLPASQAVRQLRTNVGMVFQQYHLWPHLTVLENLIEAPCQVLKMSKVEAIKKAAILIKRLRLHDLEHRFPLQLSGGQQQRVSIARALMMSPKVMLYDEPTAALDPQITAQFTDIINELSQSGITQVIVTHEVALAEKVATKIIYMEDGRIVEQGSKDILQKPSTDKFREYLFH